jgi:glycosyltransferase involved in cell wall biosynthesis
MRIAVDVKLLRTNNAGIGRYVRNTLDALQAMDTNDEFLLFSPAPVHYDIINSKWKIIVEKGDVPGPGIVWQQFTLPKLAVAYKADVVWGPEQTIFHNHPQGVKTVLSVHDLVYKRYPKTMRKSVYWVNRLFFKKSLLAADKIVTVSKFTQRELSHFYPALNPSKITTIPNGLFHLPEKSNEPRGDFLFCTCSMEPRKNLRNLVHALEILHKEGLRIKLVLSGPFGWRNKKFRELLEKTPARNLIENKAFVSEQELRHLYGTCRGFIYPSFYEGFGLPVLEAFAMGAPVLTSKDSSMEEILGTCAAYFDPQSPDSIASEIRKFWTEGPRTIDGTERDRILQKYTNENAAKQLLSIFRSLEKGQAK